MHLRTSVRLRVQHVLADVGSAVISTPVEIVSPDDTGNVSLRSLTVFVAVRSADDLDNLDDVCLDVEARLRGDWVSVSEGALGAMLFDWQQIRTEIDPADLSASLEFVAKYLVAE